MLNNVVFIQMIPVIMIINSFLQASEPVDGNKVTDKMPVKVNHLFTWPSYALITEKQSLLDDADKNSIIRARKSAILWINKLIDKDWLPNDPNEIENNLILIKDAHDSIDIIYLEWTKNGYVFKMGQSLTIIAVNISLEKPKPVKITQSDRINYAKQICQEVLNKTANIWEIKQPDGRREIIKKDVMPIILSSSFEHGQIQNASDGIHVKYRSKPKKDDEEDMRYWDYWFRRINWWTDGSSAGFYTLKTEGGAWAANYIETEADKKWFESPSGSKTQDSSDYN